MGAFPRFRGSVEGYSQLIRRELLYWRMFKRAVREVSATLPCDLIILPYVDYCFHALSILGAPFLDIPWCGISMRLSISNLPMGIHSQLPWKWRMAKRLLSTSSLKALFVINPSVNDVPPTWYTPRELSKLRYLPDPPECEVTGSRCESRTMLGLTNEKVAILVFGSIDERKGVDSLVAAVASQADLANFVVILAGMQSAEIRRELTAPLYARQISQHRLIVLDRFVGDAELGGLLAASDVVWVGYRNHIYMSGVLVLAGKAGLPVVGSMEGEIGRLISKHAIGALARIEQPAEVAIALRTVLDRATRLDMGRRARLAFEHHDTESFGASVLSAFDSKDFMDFRGRG
jgi:glycosyltransferase involved in cell wall biosynthesis